MNMLATPLLLLVILPSDDKPTPKLPLGKETTYITEPLDKDGYLDYEAALNDRLGKGITPEKNANVLIWKALGPRPEGGKGMPAEFFKQLGMEEPPENGDYFIDLGRYVNDQLKLAPSEFKSMIYDQQSEAAKRPWATTDCPHIAAWLKANEKPLAVVVEATQRPDYFNPLVSREKSGLVGALLPAVQKCRGLAIALAARAMQRVEEGKFSDAWQDLLACHRLGRLVGRGATLIEGLVGVAIEHVASGADLAYLERAGLTAKQVRERMKDLESLPPIVPLADKIDLGERFMFLDSTQMIRRHGLAMLDSLSGGPGPVKPDPEAEKAMAEINWEPALRNGNRWYDRMVAALRLKERVAREKELDKIDSDLKSLKKDAAEGANLLLAKDKPKEAGKAMSDILIGLLMPAVRKVQNAYDRTEQVHRNLRVAFALAAYKSDNGSYAAKLDDLAPKYLSAIPDDLFSARALIYRPTEKGYLLYSVGVNGKDDEGRWTDDDQPGDDIGVRMPLPERKPKK
jgi:hypothetical protein